MFNLFRRKKRVNIETDFGKFPDDRWQFVEEWIATYDDRIIAHSKNLHELMKALDAKYPEIGCITQNLQLVGAVPPCQPLLRT